ncbi:MAG: NAD(P)H-dependent oxidoreductase subunit E [Actinomycetota bacterium]|nr:NAD(P)H-dependent oxidoreductase subunit E [Actinomycetota bacterium]
MERASADGPAAGWDEVRAKDVIARLAGLDGPLLPVLRGLVEELGYIDPRAVPLVAEALNLSRAEVHGVIGFYADLRREPPGRRVVRVCRAEACQALGAEALLAHACEHLSLRVGETAPDGGVSLEQVFCLGNCALGPSVMVDGVVVGRVDADRFDELVASGAPRHRPGPTSGPVRVFVPADSAARAVGADAVAAALVERAGGAIGLVRNGSRGMLWAEPLVEVELADGTRVAYGPVAPDDVDGLLDAGLLEGGDHPLRLGPTEQLDWLARQQRVTFARVGVVDPVSTEDYEAHGGLVGLRRALRMEPAEIVAAVTESGLRGRGGAGFPAGIKWSTVADARDEVKYVCANADEGDSGTFADRMLLEGDPLLLVEAMTIAGLAVGATKGFVYIRSEYPDAIGTFSCALAAAGRAGWLGASVLGSGRAFDIEVRVGAGSYICGEETAMLESLEGRRGMVRAKPPLPAVSGLFGRPTLVNNVLTLAAVPGIIAEGPDAYRALGVGRSRGTQIFQLGGNVARGGIVELGFGVSLSELVAGFGGGSASGRPVRAVQVGGPLGAYLPEAQWDLPVDYEAFASAGAMVGHGGVVVFDDSVDMALQARFAMEFCAEESCGKCTPCRVGAVRGVEVIDRIIAGGDPEADIELLEELCEVMADGSLCAMGGLTPMPVRSALARFPQDFRIRRREVAT